MSSPARSLTVANLSLPATQAAGHLQWLFEVVEKALDLAAVLAAVYASNALYQALEPRRAADYASSSLLLCGAGFGLLFVILVERHGGYRPGVSLLAIRETERILRVTLQAFLVAELAAYLCTAPVSRMAFSIALITVPLFVTLEKWEVHNLLRVLRSRGYGTRKAVIFGTGPAARRIYSALVRSPKFGVDPVAFVENDPQSGATDIYESSYQRRHSAKVIHEPLCPELFRQLKASVLVLADPSLDPDATMQTIARASQAGVSTYFVANDFLEPGYWVDYAELDGVMLAHLGRGATRLVYETGKRIFDLVVAVCVLLLFAPFALFIALLVRFTSPGPIFFRQQRVGLAGRRFNMYKFRSMYSDAPQYGYSPGTGDDPRVTPLGRFLRHTSLDELPQFVNVLLGEMSVVGPRPEMPFIVEQYTPLQQQRLSVKPGITGLWQLSADRAFQIHENMEYDLYYFRVNIVYLQVPSLRDRIEDIPILAQHLLSAIMLNGGRREMRIAGSAVAALERYPWPGNIRELRNVLERAALIAEDGLLKPEHLHFQGSAIHEPPRADTITGTLKQMECVYINHVLHAERGSIERAARRLGIPRSSLYNKMRRCEIPQGTGRL